MRLKESDLTTVYLKEPMNIQDDEGYNIAGWSNPQPIRMNVQSAGGTATAQIYKALGAKVLAYDPSYNVEYEPYVEYTDFDTVVKNADILSLHTPLLPSTENMIAAPQFKMMKDNAYLINMARGKLVNTADLISALENKEIAGAGLDTLADETSFFGKQVSSDQIPDDYKKLAAMPNVLVTPHVAFLTETSIRNMVEISLNDAVTILEGKHSRNEIRM